jgi:hypothetical protein
MASANTWLWISLVVFGVILAALAAAAAALSIKNILTYNDELIYPFVGYLGAGNTLSKKDGSNQILCPTGKTARILGAYYEVYDPYLTCVTTPGAGASKPFQKSCTDAMQAGLTLGCGDSPGCVCTADGCRVSSGSPKQSCECANVDPTKGFQNCACSNYNGQNQYDCKSRDISAYLAKMCNGQQSCTVSLDPTLGDQQLVDMFGPFPCKISPTTDQDKYKQLPMVRANDGLGGNKPTDMRQGYYIHGLFTCE